MSKYGTAGLYFLPSGTTMNGQNMSNYCKTSWNYIMDVHETESFMHDGAPCHRLASKIVTNYLKRIRVKTLDWPGNSWDLNPIEHLLTIMKDNVADRQPSSTQALVTAIKDVCIKELSPDYRESLENSMPRHVQAVIQKPRWSYKILIKWHIYYIYTIKFYTDNNVFRCVTVRHKVIRIKSDQF